MNLAGRIHRQAMPLNQEIEHRHRERQAGTKIHPTPMRHFFEMGDCGEHSEHRFNQIPLGPAMMPIDFQVGWIAAFGMKAAIGQHEHLLPIFINQRMESRIIDIGGMRIPVDDEPPLIEQHGEFATHNPLMMRPAQFANLTRTGAAVRPMDQFNAIDKSI